MSPQGLEVWRNFGAWVETAKPSFGADISARLERASGFRPGDATAAEPVAAAVSDLVGRLRLDEAVLLPAAGAVAPRRDADHEEREGARRAAGRLTCIASLAGAPSVSLPLASVHGLPAGIGLIAPPGGDRALLAAALSAPPAG